MKNGLIVPNGFGLVYVYSASKYSPKKLVYDNHNSINFGDGIEAFRLVGVFLYNKKQRQERESNKKYHQKPNQEIGRPEGFEVLEKWEWNNHFLKEMWAGKFEIRKGCYNRHRSNYKKKLCSILKKAKELMELGIENKAALQAARKCACHI